MVAAVLVVRLVLKSASPTPPSDEHWQEKLTQATALHDQTLAGIAAMQGTGQPKDAVKAVALFKGSAEGGERVAQLFLGMAYLGGEGGLAQSDLDGARWLERAAEQRVVAAQARLAQLYALEGRPAHDDQRALLWASVVKASGAPADQPPALKVIEVVTPRLAPEQRAATAAAVAAWLAAHAG